MEDWSDTTTSQEMPKIAGNFTEARKTKGGFFSYRF